MKLDSFDGLVECFPYPGSKKALILFLGTGALVGSGTQLAKALRKRDKVSVYVSALPGHFETDADFVIGSRKAADYTKHADSLMEYVSGRRYGEICVMGHSYGTNLAMYLAKTYPEKVTTLLGIGVPVGFANFWHSFGLSVVPWAQKLGLALLLLVPLELFGFLQMSAIWLLVWVLLGAALSILPQFSVIGINRKARFGFKLLPVMMLMPICRDAKDRSRFIGILGMFISIFPSSALALTKDGRAFEEIPLVTVLNLYQFNRALLREFRLRGEELSSHGMRIVFGGREEDPLASYSAISQFAQTLPSASHLPIPTDNEFVGPRTRREQLDLTHGVSHPEVVEPVCNWYAEAQAQSQP